MLRPVDGAAASASPPPLDAALSRRLRERAALLEARGCHTYQLVEAPEAVQLGAREMDERVARLRAAGCTDVSAPLLLLASEADTAALRQRVSERGGGCAEGRWGCIGGERVYMGHIGTEGTQGARKHWWYTGAT